MDYVKRGRISCDIQFLEIIICYIISTPIRDRIELNAVGKLHVRFVVADLLLVRSAVSEVEGFRPEYMRSRTGERLFLNIINRQKLIHDLRRLYKTSSLVILAPVASCVVM